jgi:diguanylate cyclase (GGDEF)-like protein
LLYGASFIWAGATLSLLIGYLYIQNQRLITDYLTGAYNRLEIDRYLQQKIDSATDYPFVGILIDLDDFKKINDNYGHVVGDEILISTVKLLKNSITTNDFLARYGGDEFLIILNEKASAKTNLILRRIEENVEKYNQGSPYPFRLKLSIGYDWYDVRQAMSATDFLKHIDSKMYRSKKNKHR